MSRTALNNGDTGLAARTAINNNFISCNIKVYNVEDYGAVHDGSTDDTSAIQDAINACFTAGGGTVYFPNGVYVIEGALQNAVGDDSIDYNSQLYIPNTKLEDSMDTISIELLGESWSDNNRAHPVERTPGAVTLKSTIAGTGTWPSVICGRGINGTYGYQNYTTVHMKNITILVNPHNGGGGTGASVSGVNFMYLNFCTIENVTASLYIDDIQNSLQPANNSFGIAVGCPQNAHPIVYNAWASGFYYNFMFGEGTLVNKIESYWGYIGVHLLTANVGLVINWMNILGCKYSIASQQEAVYEMSAGVTYLDIVYAMLETDAAGSRAPAWSTYTDIILDSASNIKGFMKYDWSDGSSLGNILTKSNGGLNLFAANMRGPRGFQWASGERTFSAATRYIIGRNSTTNRMEYFDGGAYRQLTEDP